jgi:hypothetical protein
MPSLTNVESNYLAFDSHRIKWAHSIRYANRTCHLSFDIVSNGAKYSIENRSIRSNRAPDCRNTSGGLNFSVIDRRVKKLLARSYVTTPVRCIVRHESVLLLRCVSEHVYPPWKIYGAIGTLQLHLSSQQQPTIGCFIKFEDNPFCSLEWGIWSIWGDIEVRVILAAHLGGTGTRAAVASDAIV